MTRESLFVGDVGSFRAGKRIVVPRKALETLNCIVKIYTMTPDPDAVTFQDDYLQGVRDFIHRVLGDEIDIGTRLGLAVLSEKLGAPRAYFNLTMWTQEKEGTPPIEDHHLYVYDRGEFPQGLVKRADGDHCIYEEQITGFEASVTHEYCMNPNSTTLARWLLTVYKGELPMKHQ